MENHYTRVCRLSSLATCLLFLACSSSAHEEMNAPAPRTYTNEERIHIETIRQLFQDSLPEWSLQLTPGETIEDVFLQIPEEELLEFIREHRAMQAQAAEGIVELKDKHL